MQTTMKKIELYQMKPRNVFFKHRTLVGATIKNRKTKKGKWLTFPPIQWKINVVVASNDSSLGCWLCN